MMCGFLPVNKPLGPTSAQVVAQVRRLTGLRRVGHSGTLDPGADGVLVLGLNRSTVLLPYLPAVKSYRAEAVLGITTDTLDAQGAVVAEKPVPALGSAEVAAALGRFTGEILQVPPRISALKHEGRRLYALARAGRSVDKPARPVTVYELKLLAFIPPRVVFSVTCSGGTYVRVLAADLGAALGCGAHLARLTRTASNGFELAAAAGLDELAAEAHTGRWQDRVVAPSSGLAHLPAVTVGAERARGVIHGRPLPLSADAPEFTAPVRILDAAGTLLAVARRRDRLLTMERVLQPVEEGEACV